MELKYNVFDKLHSIIDLVKTQSKNQIFLNGRSNDPMVKILLISSSSGKKVFLESVFKELCDISFSGDGQLITDSWLSLQDGSKAYFQSIQNTRCQVGNEPRRYTAFAYILRNGQIEIYDCDNATITHKSYVDITISIYYTVEKKYIEHNRFLRAPIRIDSGYYKIQFECENEDLYKTGYVDYVCGDFLIPLTREMIQKGFFVKVTRTDPELVSRHKELIDLWRK